MFELVGILAYLVCGLVAFRVAFVRTFDLVWSLIALFFWPLHLVGLGCYGIFKLLTLGIESPKQKSDRLKIEEARRAQAQLEFEIAERQYQKMIDAENQDALIQKRLAASFGGIAAELAELDRGIAEEKQRRARRKSS